MGRRFSLNYITAAIQLYNLKKSFPNSDGFSRGTYLKWKILIQPTPLSRKYEIEIKYKVPKRPRINVLSPILELNGKNKKLPHTYKGPELCLYYPKYKEWHAGLKLADTIVPWTSEWLFFYEIWLITGEWRGGGIHN